MIRRPLREAGMTKTDIRLLSREMGLPTWNLPSTTCLGTRIPYGEEITDQKLSRIERAEDSLRAMGFSPLRVRDHGTVARVELPVEDIPAAADARAEIVAALKPLGYQYVALDLEGRKVLLFSDQAEATASVASVNP